MYVIVDADKSRQYTCTKLKGYRCCTVWNTSCRCEKFPWNFKISLIDIMTWAPFWNFSSSARILMLFFRSSRFFASGIIDESSFINSFLSPLKYWFCICRSPAVVIVPTLIIKSTVLTQCILRPKNWKLLLRTWFSYYVRSPDTVIHAGLLLRKFITFCFILMVFHLTVLVCTCHS